MAERDAIVGTIRSSPNLGVAARRLGVARKTLYNRMREFQLPPGRSGRPRHTLSYHAPDVGALVGFAALLGVGWLAGKWWKERHAPTVAGDVAGNVYVHGTDILGCF